jgi:hypothetical protein
MSHLAIGLKNVNGGATKELYGALDALATLS